jgi:hypothetical protein
MSDNDSQVPHSIEWRLAYEAVLQENDTSALFKHVEIAEAAILTRRDSLASSLDHHEERAAIEQALAQLELVKRKRLGFPKS